MHLNQIHSFLAVSKTLNFTGAARQLGVPQSTISRQISDLESQLGVRLFYRTRRDVQLTEEGRAFLPYAQEISEAASRGAFAVRQLREGAAGRLAIAVCPACQAALAGPLAAFHEKHPNIDVDLTPISAGDSLMEDTQSPYDFWLLYREMLLDPERFDYRHLGTQPLCIVRAAAQETSVGDNIAGEPFILLSEEADPILYMQAMNYCRTHRFTPKVRRTFPDISSVLLTVSAGLGISILPASLLPGASRFTSGADMSCAVSSDRTDLTPSGAYEMSPAASYPVIPALNVQPLEEDSYALDMIAAWKPSLLNPAAALFLQVLTD